jgi:hypothetical protein
MKQSSKFLIIGYCSTTEHDATEVLRNSTCTSSLIQFLLTGFENTVCLSVRFLCAGTRGCVVDPTTMVGSNCSLSRTRPSVSSCFTAILLAVPAGGYWPNLVWIGQQTSLLSLFLAITDAFQLEVFLLSTKLLLVVLLYHHYKIYYKLYYVTLVATLLVQVLLSCDFPFATPQLSTVPGISHTSILNVTGAFATVLPLLSLATVATQLTSSEATL